MQQISVLLTIVFIVSIIFLLSVAAFIVWQKKQQLRKKKIIEKLINRSYRLVSILESVPDRYLPIQTKMLLIDYLHSIVPNLVSKRVSVPELMVVLPELSEIRSQLRDGIQKSKNEKVMSKTHCTKIQNALHFLPVLLREFSEKHIIDSRSAKRQAVLMRFSYSLVHYDLLLYQAKVDLVADRKASALDKYRSALAEIEKVAVIENVAEEIEWVKCRIAKVEEMLFVTHTSSSSLDSIAEGARSV
ncbi:hypothetical protein [Marinomonas pollencensis]|uniref:Uncharacterized protein n=1 Tax=Marinomonas pollencensis TaxID=491954 RepID=A0A3E0DV88_9GAMM|nr:hypothetical protein [Marinomonas pollencensis]REG86775.1 hypothetical protein DFP81_101343 [Marinomonas pollencensis]